MSSAAAASPFRALRAEPLMIGMSSPGELVRGQQLAYLELDELEQLLVVDHVGLVEEDHDRRHADLAGEQDVLARLRHRAVGGGDHEDRPVHLRGAGDHVLDVVGVARAVDVGVVPVLGLVLHVGGGDRDAALALLGGLVDRVERDGLGAPPTFSARTLVMAAVRVVLPWSTWPMVPTFTWGLDLSNFSFAIDRSLWALGRRRLGRPRSSVGKTPPGAKRAARGPRAGNRVLRRAGVD